MTRTNIALAAAAFVAATSCVVLLWNLNAARERVAVLEEQVAELQRDINTPQPVLSDDGTAPVSEPAEQPAAAKPATSASSSPAVSKPEEAQRKAEIKLQRRLNADPAYRAARLAEYRLEVRGELPALKAELGLSQDEADRFIDLLAEQRLRESEAGNADAGGETTARIKERHEQAEKERRELLGEERYRAWTEYVNSASARALVSALRTHLATSSSPLRDDQAKPLVKALAAEHQRHAADRQANYNGIVPWTDDTPAAERIEYMERRAQLIEESLERSSEAAAMYLDSVQQRRFDEMLDRQLERERVEFAAWRAFLEAEERARVTKRDR